MAQQEIFVYNNAMIKKPFFTFQAFLGLFLAPGSIITMAVIDHPRANRQSVTFIASTGDSLVGTYYPGTKLAGVILLEGFMYNIFRFSHIPRI